MNKLITVCMALLIMLIVSVEAHAQLPTHWFFSGAGGDSLWTNEANWDKDRQGTPVDPGTGYPGDFDNQGALLNVIARTFNGKRALITDGMSVTLKYLGAWSNLDPKPLADGFDMTGGMLQLVGQPAHFEIASNASNWPITINTSGGTMTGWNFVLGGRPGEQPDINSDGTWNISGTAMVDFFSSGQIGNPGPTVQKSYGTLNMSGDGMLTVTDLIISETGNGLVTIADNAKIITLGNDEQQLTDDISSGWITSLAAGMVPMAMYDEGLDQTTVELVIDPNVGSLTGDYDASGEVEVGDLNLVLFNWDQPGAGLPPEWVNEVPTGNVGVDELNGVLFNWGNTAAVATVPEPTTAILSLVAIGLFGRFIRRSWR